MTVSGSVVGIEGTSSLRRASSIRRTFTTGTAGVKRKSVCLQVKFQVVCICFSGKTRTFVTLRAENQHTNMIVLLWFQDGIIETLRRTRLHFIHCMLPQHNAGLCELKTTILMPSKTSCSEEILINVPLIRSQLRGANILDSVRLHKQGTQLYAVSSS